MNRDEVNADLLAWAKKHGIGIAVVLFKDGSTLSVRALGATAVDRAGAEAIGRIVEEAVLAAKAEVAVAMALADRSGE